MHGRFLGESFGRKHTSENTARARPALDLHLTAQTDQRVLDDREPQTSAATFRRSSLVDTVETLCKPGNMHRVDTDTVVHHDELYAGIAATETHIHGAA